MKGVKDIDPTINTRDKVSWGGRYCFLKRMGAICFTICNTRNKRVYVLRWRLSRPRLCPRLYFSHVVPTNMPTLTPTLIPTLMFMPTPKSSFGPFQWRRLIHTYLQSYIHARAETDTHAHFQDDTHSHGYSYGRVPLLFPQSYLPYTYLYSYINAHADLNTKPKGDVRFYRCFYGHAHSHPRT